MRTGRPDVLTSGVNRDRGGGTSMSSPVRARRPRALGIAAAGLAAVALAIGASPISAQEASGEITYSIWGDSTELSNQQALVDAFEESHPGITVNVNVSDWETYWTGLQTSIAGGDAP